MQNWLTILFTVLCGYWTIIQSSKVSVGVIRNVSLKISQSNTTLSYGTCQSCLCALYANPSLFGFNCFSSNLTCEMYAKADQDKPFSLLNFATSSFYFFSFPTYEPSPSTANFIAELTTVSTPPIPVEYLWTFDSTFQDLSATFSGIAMGGANFSSTSITGYGSSLFLSASKSQYLNIPNPQLKLHSQSWTFEAWIYLTNSTNGTLYGIVGQCKNNSNFTCLHLAIRYQKLYLGFSHNDLLGNTTLTTSKYYHVAFVFDCDTLSQSLYLDGMIDGGRKVSTCFQGRQSVFDLRNDRSFWFKFLL